VRALSTSLDPVASFGPFSHTSTPATGHGESAPGRPR
jgi:hypothetical protein